LSASSPKTKIAPEPTDRNVYAKRKTASSSIKAKKSDNKEHAATKKQWYHFFGINKNNMTSNIIIKEESNFLPKNQCGLL
jgi:hypothetical protein